MPVKAKTPSTPPSGPDRWYVIAEGADDKYAAIGPFECWSDAWHYASGMYQAGATVIGLTHYFDPADGVCVIERPSHLGVSFGEAGATTA